jgi:CRISPR/Cas system CMR subunit Cmr4 (Cas7 group RAMP superfamily)
MSIYQLHFRILSYWHCGSGRGAGSTVDAVVHKDFYGLPEIPGRTVKGLLRDAVQRSEHWGHLKKGTTRRWFGSDSRNFEIDKGQELSFDDNRLIDRHRSEPGLLIFDNAVMVPEVTAWLQQEEAGFRQELYRHLYATAINPETGSAKEKSLRGTEVVIPLDLFAPLSVRPNAESEDSSWISLLPQCLPLIRGLGLSRNRGMGRCQVTLMEVHS